MEPVRLGLELAVQEANTAAAIRHINTQKRMPVGVEARPELEGRDNCEQSRGATLYERGRVKKINK